MSEVNETEKMEARFSMLYARINDLEAENKRYLETIHRWEGECRRLEAEVEKLKGAEK